MRLGQFFMPLHRPEKPWVQALAEDREAIIAAHRSGYGEVWMGEHFTTKTEAVPSPLVFLATLIHETPGMLYGTGVINLGHRHPMVVAGETALFDQLSGGRLLVGVGPGGLTSDAEMFGRPDMDERFELAMETIDMIVELWTNDAPVEVKGRFWSGALNKQIWPSHGVGTLPHPAQFPHPPLAMAMVSPSGRTTDTVAERGFIPISANFVSVGTVEKQWASYTGRREELGLDVDRSLWRVCRSILVTESDDQAAEFLADPDGPFAYYFRYLAGVRDMIGLDDDLGVDELFERFDVATMIGKCVIAGSAQTVTDKLVTMVDRLGPFGTLVSVGHDFDEAGLFRQSIDRLAEDVAPTVAAHMASL